MGKDTSSLVLTEQSKALPTAINEPDDEASASERASLEMCADACGMSPSEVLQLISSHESQGKSFLAGYVRSAWLRSYKAFRNEHFDGSKYLSKRFQQRSKLFKPKTRSAIRKNQSSAAGAMFGSADVVTLTAQDESNPKQRASAALKQEIMNYRLDRHGNASIPWFLVSMGAHQDAQITGLSVSKQYWKWEERKSDGAIVFDRPDILNIPPENLILDANCEWTRPAQTSPVLTVRFAMTVAEVVAMLGGNEASKTKWLPVSKDKLLQHAGMTPDDIKAVRGARSGGQDGQEIQPSHEDSRIIWVYENFIRKDGEDYQCWSIGGETLLSVPQYTYVAYPEYFGNRPYVIGFGALETHRAYPMAPTESWQQLQQEANDLVNLRLDQMKKVVNPVAKVKRGRMIDLDAVQRSAQDGVMLVTDMEDMEWDRPPDVPASAYNESNYLNNDFDELAGSFSTSSVQSNRSLNDTVGGMKLLNNAASNITEFDLKVWIETWAEPVLGQLLKLEEFYESDEKVLVLAGNKAELVERYGIDEITDTLLKEDVTLKVAAGIGAGDPMQSLTKLQAGLTMVGEAMSMAANLGQPVPEIKWTEFIDEVVGKTGYKNAFERFFIDPSQKPPQPDPNAMAEAEKEKAKAEQEAIKAQEAEKNRQLDASKAQLASQDKGKDRASKEKIEALKLQAQQIAQLIDAEQDAVAQHQAAQGAEKDRAFQRESSEADRNFQRESSLTDHIVNVSDKQADRGFQAQSAEKDRGFQRESADQDRNFQRETRAEDRSNADKDARRTQAFTTANTARDHAHQREIEETKASAKASSADESSPKGAKVAHRADKVVGEIRKDVASLGSAMELMAKAVGSMTEHLKAQGATKKPTTINHERDANGRIVRSTAS